jgi:hypothetical protein
MLDRIRELPDGSWTSTARLLNGLHPEFRDCEGDLFALYFELLRKAEKEGILLDMSSHEDKLEGLPFNLDFQIFHSGRAE